MGNAGTLVGDGERDHLALANARKADQAARVGEADRIREQIVEDLAHAGLVGDQLVDILGDLDLERKMNAAHALFDAERRRLDEPDDLGRSKAKLQGACVDVGEIQNVVDGREQRLGRARDGRKVFPLLLVQFTDARALEQLREADDARERRAQLIGHVADELALEPVCRDERLIALLECAGVALGDRDIGEADERAAVRQRQRGIIDHALIRARHLAGCVLTLVGESRCRLGDVAPLGRLVVQDLALTDDLVDVRLVLQHAAAEFPDALEGLVEELEAAVRAEHRDAFREMVERLALYADQLIVAAFERKALGLVLIKIGDAAVGALLGHDMHRAAIGNVPPFLGLRAGLVAGEHFRLPLAVVHDLGDAAALAQAIEQLAVHGALTEPIRIELPELGEGIVEEAQALIAREDGDGGRDAVERAIEGGDEPVELAFGTLDGRDVDRAGDARLAERQHHDVVMAALAADDERHALAEAFPAHEHVGELLALARLQELELAVRDLDFALGADRAHVGLVHPLDLAAAAADPYGMGECIVERAAKADVAGELAVLRDDLGDLLAVAGNVPEAQDGAATRDASVRLDITAGTRAEQQVERLALREKRIELGFEVACRLGLEPGAEAHEELRILGEARHGGQRMRGNAHVLALLPEDQDLRLGLDDGFGGREAAAQLDDLVASLPKAQALLQPGTPDQHDHGDRGASENRNGQQPAEPDGAEELNTGVEGCDRQHGNGGDRRHQQEDEVLACQPPSARAFRRVHPVPGIAKWPGGALVLSGTGENQGARACAACR